ncbi:kinase-like domain-containing protein [Rhizophagus irregularis DAOM 181602=DAOM 197198]|nr:kinase-like domain-containing protein [Rhizophagus irregularis DAOM 181602=DAOM 197198]
MSAEYLNEIKILWDLCQIVDAGLSFYGMTKDPETEELIIISEYADKGNLRSVLLHNFNNTFNLTKPVNSSIITGYLNDEENNKDLIIYIFCVT